jgi:hypothetical protein
MLWLAIAIPFAASAQMVPNTAVEPAPVEIPENLTQAQVRDLIARMSDDQVRELIIQQLDKNALAADQASDASAYFDQLSMGLNAAGTALGRMFDSREQLHSLPSMVWQGISMDGSVSGAYLLFQFIGLMVVGFATERLARRILEKTTSKPVEILSFGKRFDLACYGAALGMVELGAFALGAIIFIEITGQQTEAAVSLWYQVIWCLLLIKLVLLAVRQVAAPASADARLVSITDNAARQIWGWTLVLTSSLILPLPVVEVASEFGASPETGLLIRVLFSAVFVVLLIALVFRLRHYGARLIAGDDADGGVIRQGLARTWWMLTIVYVLIIWLMTVGKRAACCCLS